jgi:hypothetical protein
VPQLQEVQEPLEECQPLEEHQLREVGHPRWEVPLGEPQGVLHLLEEPLLLEEYHHLAEGVVWLHHRCQFPLEHRQLLTSMRIMEQKQHLTARIQ